MQKAIRNIEYSYFSVKKYIRNIEYSYITVQKAKVHRNLASIGKMVKAGNRVVFDEKDGVNTSYMLHKASGSSTAIRHNGIYEFDLWVKDKAKYGKYGVFANEEGDEGDGVPPPPAAIGDRNKCGHKANNCNCKDTVKLDFHRHAWAILR